jgi:phosphoribosylformimino-5-aminoimidazole carboxamide ribotide isomerase
MSLHGKAPRGAAAPAERSATLLVPVLDLAGGLVVHAVRGQRERYLPVESVLVDVAEPLAVAVALHACSGAAALYIADLDAILGRGENAAAVRAIARGVACELWLDAGTADAAGALAARACGAKRIIVGTESLPTLEALDEIAAAVGRENMMISLDVLGGKLVSRAGRLSGLPPLEALEKLAASGWERFILLTLDGVGAEGGPDWALLAPARRLAPKAELFAGGGVRGPQDMRKASELGLEGALVGTALHRGRLAAGMW